MREIVREQKFLGVIIKTKGEGEEMPKKVRTKKDTMDPIINPSAIFCFSRVIYDIEWIKMFKGALPNTFRDRVYEVCFKFITSALFIHDYTFLPQGEESINKSDLCAVHLHFKNHFLKHYRSNLDCICLRSMVDVVENKEASDPSNKISTIIKGDQKCIDDISNKVSKVIEMTMNTSLKYCSYIVSEKNEQVDENLLQSYFYDVVNACKE